VKNNHEKSEKYLENSSYHRLVQLVEFSGKGNKKYRPPQHFFLKCKNDSKPSSSGESGTITASDQSGIFMTLRYLIKVIDFTPHSQ
jgi:hypothetical protein